MSLGTMGNSFNCHLKLEEILSTIILKNLRPVREAQTRSGLTWLRADKAG
jgi:hypothetical protein